MATLIERLGKIKEKESKKSFYRETEPVEESLMSREIRRRKEKQNTTGTRNRRNLNPSAEDDLDLISVVIGRDRLNNPTVSQGKIGELYSLYMDVENEKRKIESKLLQLENKAKEYLASMESKPQEIRNQFNAQENPTEILRLKERLELSISSKVKQIKGEMKEDIERIKESYEINYQNELNEVAKYYKATLDIIQSFGIRQRAVRLPEINLDELDVEELFEIAVTNANLINKLEDYDETNNLEIYDIEEQLEKRSALIVGLETVSKFFAPISLGTSLFGLGKKMFGMTKIRGMVEDLENEILIVMILLRTKYNLLEETYEPPNLDPYYQELESVEEDVRQEFYTSLKEVDERLKDFEENAPKRRQEMEEKIVKFKEMSQQRYNEILKNLEEYRGKAHESLNNLLEDYELRRQKFLSSVRNPQFEESELIEKLKVLEEITKGIRTYNDYELLCSLDYKTDLPEETDDPAVLEMIEYDKELLEEREVLRKKIEEFQAIGKTKEVLEKEKEDKEREIDEYYLVSSSDIVLGEYYTTPTVKETINVSENAVYPLGNRSAVFVYNNREEEDLLVEYIKFQVQQLLAMYHPESIKVNIFNETMSNKFNNLQVDLSTFDEEKQAIVDGMPYCTVYSNKNVLEDITKEQTARISELNATELIDKTFDELVLARRKIGGIVPNYFLNIFHREGLNNDLMKVSSESPYNGIINYLLVPRTDLYEIEDDDIKPNRTGLDAIADVELIVEIKDGLIYITDYAEQVINRLEFKPRPKEEVVTVGKGLRSRALQLQKLKGFSLVKEYIDQVTGGKYWQKSAKKLLELHIGYIEGDKSKPYPVVMNEENQVHFLFVGSTGGGKSNILSVIVNCLKIMYPPSQLDITYFDFKVVEVGMHVKPYKMPHCTAMTGTGQAEYLVSLVTFVFDLMEERYALMDSWGVEKLSKLIEKMEDKVEELREQGRHTEAEELYVNIPRRHLMIIDEAAQAFKHPDPTVVETIKDVLTKLGEKARAAGIHMLLVTQEPSKIPQSLMEQCTIRGCTRASTAVSKASVGNDFCGRLENNFIGFFGVNSAGGDPAANRRYVVPLASGSTTKILSKIAYSMSKDDINRNAVIFNDQDPFDYSRLRRYLKTIDIEIDNLQSPTEKEKAKKIYQGTNFFIGEEAHFMEEFRPLEIGLTMGDMQNIAVTSVNPTEIQNHFEAMFKQMSPFIDCVPIYCKQVPDYAPVELFREATKDNTLFCPMYGKNIIEPEEVYEVEEREENGKKILIDRQICKDNVYQVVKGDIFPRALPDNDPIGAKYYNNDLLRYLKTVTRLRKTQPEIYAQRPLILFAFDFTGHSSIIMSTFPWREMVSAINEANAVGVHLVAYSSSLSAIDNRNMFSVMLSGTLMVDERYRDYKNIPTGFFKYVNKLNPRVNRVYKPVTFDRME